MGQRTQLATCNIMSATFAVDMAHATPLAVHAVSMYLYCFSILSKTLLRCSAACAEWMCTNDVQSRAYGVSTSAAWGDEYVPACAPQPPAYLCVQ